MSSNRSVVEEVYENATLFYMGEHRQRPWVVKRYYPAAFAGLVSIDRTLCYATRERALMAIRAHQSEIRTNEGQYVKTKYH